LSCRCEKRWRTRTHHRLEHILLGILRGGDKFTVALITERVAASELRSAIVGLLDQAA